MRSSLFAWIEPFVWSEGDSMGRGFGPRLDMIRDIEMSLRLRYSIDVSSYNAFRKHFLGDEDLALDTAGYCLSLVSDSPYSAPDAEHLERILEASGSVWQVAHVGKDDYRLTRRDLGPVREAITSIPSERAREHLSAAWVALASRDPNPDAAYDRSVKAIEAAAQPVILANDHGATLGELIAAMRAKPSKWTFELGNLDVVIEMCDRVWKNNLRHGTQEGSVAGHSLRQADAAVHLALTLVRFFAGGVVTGDAEV
jgi:hypothetical protein